MLNQCSKVYRSVFKMIQHGIFIWLITFITINCQINTVVDVKDLGTIEGSILTTVHGKQFLGFRGIPFAEPPIEKLRFKPPVPKTPWVNSSEPFDATSDGVSCIQMRLAPSDWKADSNETEGQEDCLVLNVYTQNSDSKSSQRPVMVFIYGGGFNIGTGSSNFYGPQRILDHDIVLVTFNYRLSSLGFLSTSDEVSPGNYGFLDQVEVLRWIKKNIHAFGGDCSKVTIFGESAGGASVVYHLLSPLSKGLFHGAIAMSGSSICPYAYTDKPMVMAMKLAEKVGCPTSCSTQLVECLRECSAEELTIATSKIETRFSPTIDGQFLVDAPMTLLRDGLVPNKVPLIIGRTSDEGFSYYSYLHSMNKTATIANVSEIIGLVLNIEKESPANLNISSKVVDRYFDGIDTENETAVRNTIIKIISDSAINAPVTQTVLDLVKSGFTPFVYSFDYLSNRSSPAHRELNFYGVGHVEEMFFLFDMPLMFPQYEGYNDPIAEKVLQLWVNFATFGNPTQTSDHGMTWTPASKESENISEFHLNKTFSISDYDAINVRDRKFWVYDVPETIAKFEEYKLYFIK